MSYDRYRSGNYHRPSFFGGFSFFPPVIKTLLIANGAVFLGIVFFGNFHIGDFYLEQFLYAAFSLLPLGHGFGFWQLFTYMFMHAGFTHLLFNMLALWMFGMELENTWGSKKFITFYLLCGIGAGLANLLIAPMFTSVGPTVGASGAIYGVLVAFGMMFPDRPIYIYFLLPIRAKYFVVMYMALEVFSIGATDGVAHFAHLGGAVIAIIYLIADGYNFGLFQKRNTFTGYTSTSTPPQQYQNISDAHVYDIKNFQKKEEEKAAQQQIDEILDKISKAGYQVLTEDEKRILFEASKKLN